MALRRASTRLPLFHAWLASPQSRILRAPERSGTFQSKRLATSVFLALQEGGGGGEGGESVGTNVEHIGFGFSSGLRIL